MKRQLFPLFFSVLPVVAQALDLTPVPSFRELEGFKIPIVLFSDAGKKISFQPPDQWKISGGGAALSLYPPNQSDAVVFLRVRPFKPLEPGLTEDLEKWARAQLPQDAVEPTFEGEAANVFTLSRLPSREFTYTYGAQGRRFTTAIAVVDWTPRERFSLIVTARAADFPATHAAAIRSMFSWKTQSPPAATAQR